MNQTVAPGPIRHRSYRDYRLGAPTALMVIVIVGLALRIPGLGRDLVTDEAMSLFVARGTDAVARIVPNGPEFTGADFARDGGWDESLLALSHTERTPPLYYLLLRVWIKLFGDSNLALRLPSALFSLTTIPALYLLTRSAFDTQTALAAAGMLAILPLHLQYSQEVRAYPLAVLLLTLATWAFWRAVQTATQPNEVRCWILYAALAAASLYTHYFAMGVLLAHGAYGLLCSPISRALLLRRLTIVLFTILILLLPWLLSPFFRGQLDLSTMYPEVPDTRVADALGRFLGSISVSSIYLLAGGLPGTRIQSASGLAAAIICSIATIVTVKLLWMPEMRPPIHLTLLLFYVPIMLMILMARNLGYSSDFDAVPRLVLLSSSGLCMLLGVTFIRIQRFWLSVLVLALILILSLHFQMVFSRAYDSSYDRPFGVWALGNVRPVVQEMNSLVGPGDLTIFDDDHLVSVWNSYQDTNAPELYMSRDPWFLNEPMDLETRWEEVERTYTDIYFVRRARSDPGEAMRLLEGTYILKSQTVIERLEIRHYRKSAGSDD